MEDKHPFEAGQPYLGGEYPIARSFKEGADHSPDWRAKLTEDYVRQIAQAKDRQAELAEVLRDQRDGYIRDLVKFHQGVPFPQQLSVQRAIRCCHVSRTARAIKAMVIAGKSMTEIAQIVSATVETIEYFEKLFFDVRPYLDQKFLLRSICHGDRWLEEAVERGVAGVSEIVLRDSPKGSRNLQHSASILHARFEDYVFKLEENNVPVSEKDFDRFIRACQLNASGALPCLDDAAEEEIKDQNISPEVKALTPAGRERVWHFLKMIIDGADKKSAQLEAGESKAETPGALEQPDGKTAAS